MELRYLSRVLFKRLWLVLLIPFIISIITAYITFFVLEPVYQTTATLYVISTGSSTGQPIDYNDLMVGQQLVKDYRELIKSRAVTSIVIDELGLTEIRPDDLAKKIEVLPKNDTRFIDITVKYSTPELTKELADKVSSVFIKKTAELMDTGNISVVDEAEIPTNPIKPKPLANIMTALFSGLVISISVVLLLEYVNCTIKTPEDVEKYLELTVLGTIPLFKMK